VPGSSVDGCVEVLGSVETLRGVLDWCRADALRKPGVPRAMDPAFPDIEVPTLYVWSDQDPAIGPLGAHAPRGGARVFDLTGKVALVTGAGQGGGIVFTRALPEGSAT